MTIVGIVLGWAIWAALCLLMIRAVMSWLPLLVPAYRPRGVVLAAFDLVNRVTDPPLRWLRRYIRPVRLGAASLDLSFMVWFVILLLAQSIVSVIF